jgi:hypothetical protein
MYVSALLHCTNKKPQFCLKKPIDQSIYGTFQQTWENGLKLVAGNGDNKEAKEDGLHDQEDRVEDPSLLYVNILNKRIINGYGNR